MKDEPAGIPISDLVDLRSKMYSYIKENNKNEKTCKGIKKNVIKSEINMKIINKHFLKTNVPQNENYKI